MAKAQTPPFHSLSFTLIEDRKPRSALKMAVDEDDTYVLHVERGSAANPTMRFTRRVPLSSALRLRDALQAAGVFGWEESYGNDPTRPSLRWTLNVVFKEGVFSFGSRGGSAVPRGFDQLLEELYRLDFPRPTQQVCGQNGVRAGGMINALGLGSLGSVGGMSTGDLGAFSATGETPGVDFSQISDLMAGGELSGLSEGDVSRLLSEIQSNPRALQQRMREEFGQLPPVEQNRILDALASTGMATRAWWERFLRG